MELVQAFNAELSTLYEVKPPISKAKMSVITKTAIKAIKMYKHIVQSVERFIAKCRPEYKVPGLYVVDSIVRQSRHQFGYDKDVFGPRFTRNFKQTFQNLFLTCPVEDKPKIVRVLNLWQRNNVFSCDVIQPLLDMANPNVELKSLSPSDELKDDNQDSSIVLSLQQLATSLAKNNTNGQQQLNSSTSSNQPDNQIRFNKKLLDFNYSDDDDDLMMKGDTPTESEQPLSTSLNITNSDDLNTNSLAFSMAQNLLSNPDLVQKLQQSIAMQSTTDQNSKIIDNLDNITSSSFFNSINQTILNNTNNDITEKLFNLRDSLKLVQQNSNQQDQFDNKQKDKLRRSISPNRRDKYSNNSKHNSLSSRRDQERSYRDNDRDRRRSDRRSSRERGRNRSRSPKISSTSQNRKESSFLNLSSSNYQQPSTSVLSPESKERERENERRKKGLPAIRKNYLTICSTTLWLGHLPKSTTEIDISDAFGEYGTINTIDLISARGCAYVCMNRRQDAHKALQNLKNSGNLKLHNKNLKMAWSPGKGMKGKEYKEYWDVDLGVSYIPYDKINRDTDFELLEDGGFIDPDSMSENLIELRNKKLNEEKEQKKLNELNATQQLETSVVNTSTVNSLTTSVGLTIQPPIPPPKSIGSAQLMPPFVPMPNMPFNLPPGIMNLPPPLPFNLPPGIMNLPPPLPILPMAVQPPNLINNLEKKQMNDGLPVNSNNNQNTPNKSQQPSNMFHHQSISLPNNHLNHQNNNNSINPWSAGIPPPFLATKNDQPPPHQFFAPTNDDLNFNQPLFEPNLLMNPQLNGPPMILPPFQDDSLNNSQFNNDKRDLKFNNRDNWRRKDQQRNNNRNNRFNNNNLNNNYSSNNDDHRQNNKRKRNDNYNNLNNSNNKNNKNNKKKFNNNNNNNNKNKQQNNQQNKKQFQKNKNDQQRSDNNDDKSINELNDNEKSLKDNSTNELDESINDNNDEVNNLSFNEENNFNDKSSDNQFNNEESNNLNNSINLNENMATET